MALKIVVLAAGKGQRMRSALPKVLHPVGGVPMLRHVVETAQLLSPEAIYVIHGEHEAALQSALSGLSVHWVHQAKQQGTGHAVAQVLPFLRDEDQLLVLYGDVPLITQEILHSLIQDTPSSGLGLVIASVPVPSGFGRIVRNELGNIVRIVEDKDATAAEKTISDINTGILLASGAFLNEALPALSNQNEQGEYYLTDVVALANQKGLSIGGVLAHCPEEVLGANDRWQLVQLERYYQTRLAKHWCHRGVTFADPSRVDFRGQVTLGPDTTVDHGVIFEGEVTVGSSVHIGANVVIKDACIGQDVTILPHCVLEGVAIESGAVIGPFAHVRPGSVIKRDAKVGNFVEIKKTTLGPGSKVSHLSYLGDATIGAEVNIGAGTITCNYDGTNKWQTRIEDHAFVGSQTALVAPVTIEAGAFIGAGSTITKTAPSNQLTLSRAAQKTVTSFRKKATPNAEDKA